MPVALKRQCKWYSPFVKDLAGTINYKGEPYIAIRDVSRILSDREPYENIARQKIVLYLSDNRVKVSNLSSFIIVNNKVFQLTKNAIQKENGIYVPAKSFFSSLYSEVVELANSV